MHLPDDVRPPAGVEIIQQWQYPGPVHPALLEDAAFENCRRCGITSVQSYVTWSQIEPQEGRTDFSAYDLLVEKLIRHRLKWVPFLIQGPAYATPDWFHTTDYSLYARCLEHDRECRIQSIWNPRLPAYVQRFLKLFADRYSGSGVFESIALGISGNWGEAIYPATGGFHGDVHVHPGWWCADTFAREAFRRSCLERYGSVRDLNARWGTRFDDPSDIDFPDMGSISADVYYKVVALLPNRIKPSLKKVKHAAIEALAAVKQIKAALRPAAPPRPIDGLQRLLDFIQWYQGAMTQWAGTWLKAARACFPSDDIYLVTGGEGEPVLGADFASQAMMAAQYRAGIRITNQTDDYAYGFMRARLTASACRGFGTYFSTEEAGINSAGGVLVRVFDGASSGARGLYFKSLIGTGKDTCSGRYYSPGVPTEGADVLVNSIHHLGRPAADIDAAVLFPNTSIHGNPSLLDVLYRRGAALRSHMDFDLIDETMIAAGLLRRYRFCIVLVASRLRRTTVDRLSAWVEDGGVLMSTIQARFSNFSFDIGGLAGLLRASAGVHSKGAGHVAVFAEPTRDFLENVPRAYYNENGGLPWRPMSPPLLRRPGTFVARFADTLLWYDSRRQMLGLSAATDPSSNKAPDPEGSYAGGTQWSIR
jgi:hypothetical protein